MKKLLAPLLVLLLFLSARAQVVVFPIRDLTVWPAGVDLKLTEEIALALKRRGIEVISDGRLYSAMAKNRIRATGMMSADKLSLAKKLGGRVVLWGAKVEDNEKRRLIGIVIFATSVDSGRTYWSGFFYTDPKPTILGLNKKKYSQLKKSLINRIAEKFPGEVKAKKKFLGLTVSYFSVYPKFVHSGESVKLVLKLAGYSKGQVTAKVDGDTVFLFKNGDSYEGQFIPYLNDGRYGIYLKLKKQKFLIGYLVIDNEPPEPTLKILGAKKFDGYEFFRDRIIIIPHLKKPDSVLRWSLQIKSPTGDIALNRFGEGSLPDRIEFLPTGASAGLAREGVYKITLKVWDYAENEANATSEVYFYRYIPMPTVSAVLGNETVSLSLKDGQMLLPPQSIKVEVFNDLGVSLFSGTFKKFPINLKLRGNYRGLVVRFVITDVLGNTLDRTVNVKVKTKQEIEEEHGWVQNF